MKPRIMLLADVPGWTFDNHCREIGRRLSGKYEFYTGYSSTAFFNEFDYNVVYPLEWNLMGRMIDKSKYMTGIRSHLSWDAQPFQKVCERLREFKIVHAVSMRLYDIFKLDINIRYVTHGVDTKFFRPGRTKGKPSRNFIVGWAGNRQSKVKGFEQFIAPLAKLPGVEVAMCGYADRKLSRSDMPDWYNGLDAYICSSSSEGNCNPLLEAAASGLPVITTDNGTVPEIFMDKENAIIVERRPQAFSDAVRELQENPGLCRKLGMGARATIQDNWTWDKRIHGFYEMFEEMLNGS